MSRDRFECQELIEQLYERVKKCYSHDPQWKEEWESDDFEEYYKKEREVLIWMVHEMIRGGEYTMEGIARYTKLPAELLVDAAMGLQRNISMTLWMRVADLYLKMVEG